MLKTVVLITLVVISLSIPFHFPQAMGQTTTLSVEPKGVFGLVPGVPFSVNIVVSDVTDLYAWQFFLYYKSSVLNATSVVEGGLLKTGGISTYYLSPEFTDNYNATHGRMIVAATRTGNVTGVDGSGILATVTFKTVGYGFSDLYLEDTKLADSAKPFGNLIPHTLIHGQAYVGLVNVAVSSIDTPLVIPQGLIAYINVTAQNRGGQPQATFDVTLTYNGNPVDGTQTIVNLPNGTSKTLTFAWNILLLPLGVYNLTATATTIPGETDTSDNTLSILVHLGAADLAITNVTTSKTVIGQEHPTAVSVTVANQGEFSATSNVTVYLNQTVIATFQNVTLAGGNYLNLNSTWNALVFKGNYTLHAYVQPDPYETDTLNNNFTSPVTVMVGMPGDILSPFGVIDMKDIAYVAKRFGMTPAQSKPSLLWDPNADFDGSGKIDMKDIAIVARNFGMRDP
jgi:hypothetical protein